VSAFGHPGFLAAASILLALAVHPAARAVTGLEVPPVGIAGLALFVVLSLVARARRGAALLAAGGLVLLAAVAWDGARGQRGTLRLRVGEAKANFAEEGLGGQSLGLRPLGMPVSLEEARPGGVARLRLPVGSVDVGPGEAATVGAFRLGPVRFVATGEVSSLLVSVAGTEETQTAEVTADAPGRAFDLTISLERYFPDFALDARQQPYSKSDEARNPAALLVVERAGKRYRVFVLQSMPGLHQIEEIGRSFALQSVGPEVAADIGVHREPAAPMALLGALLVAAGAAALVRTPRPTGSGAPAPPAA
jgi:hypothetical protein